MKKSDSQSDFHDNGNSRVRLIYQARGEGEEGAVELPFVTGVLANFRGNDRSDSEPVEKRRFIDIDCENFDSVLASLSPSIVIRVPAPENASRELSVIIRFTRLDDFLPHNIDCEPLSLELVLNDPEFLKLEATWRGLFYLVSSIETGPLSRIRIFDITKKELLAELNDSAGFTVKNPLVRETFVETFCRPGGEPFGCFVGDYYFNPQNAEDVETLDGIARLSKLALAPFLTAASPRIIGLEDFRGFVDDGNGSIVWDRSDRTAWAAWQALRKSDSSLFLGLTLPRLLIREPYGSISGMCEFFQDLGPDEGITEPCYANAAFALALNIRRAYRKHGWPAQIRGLESGGQILDPFLSKDENRGFAEVSISGRSEAEFARAGFAALVQNESGRFTAFIGAQSAHLPPPPGEPGLSEKETTVYLISRLPYSLSILRFTQYLKCLFRDGEASVEEPALVQKQMNDWLSEFILVDTQSASDLELRRKPVSHANAIVRRDPDRPGSLHLQFEMNPFLMLYGSCFNFRVDTTLVDEIDDLRLDTGNTRLSVGGQVLNPSIESELNKPDLSSVPPRTGGNGRWKVVVGTIILAIILWQFIERLT